MSMKKGQYIKRLRHCGLDPQSPENKEMLKQVQHDAMRHFAVDTTVVSGGMTGASSPPTTMAASCRRRETSVETITC